MKRNQTIINITGNGYCGSSAVTDYLRGFEHIAFQQQDLEFTLLYDVDGVKDLQYHIAQCPMRFFKSDAAIKRFKRYIRAICSRNSNWRKLYGDMLIALSEEYTQALTQLTWNGWWHYDVLNTKGMKKLYHFSLLPRVNALLRKMNRQTIQILPKEKMYLSQLDEKIFTEKTQVYLQKVLAVLNPEEKEFLLLDQALPANDQARYKAFFPYPTKTIAVRRDPRDVYLIVKTIHKGDSWIPYNDVEDFIRYYSIIYRDFATEASEDYLPVCFEDMIYDYPGTARKICNFLGIDSADCKNSQFDPAVSINNVQLFRKDKRFAQDIKRIEEALPQWLYDFSDRAYGEGKVF